MKGSVFFAFVTIHLFFNTGCTKSDIENKMSRIEQGDCLKGVLVKKGICGQRIVKVLSQEKNGIKLASSWKDESSGKTFTDVFSVENICTFPSSISEGGEFTFKLSSVKENDCITCQAYTPVPAEKNSIVVSSDCTGVKS